MPHLIHSSSRTSFDRRAFVALGRATTRTAVVLGLLAPGWLVVGCQSNPATSSSSNWVVCEELTDCVGVARAVACVEGYCVDDAGDRVESGGGAPGSGGTVGSGGTAGSGGAAATGGSPGSGGDAMGGQGAAPGAGGSGTGGQTGVGGATAGGTCEDGAACDVGELCVLATTVTGPSQTAEYLCVDDPCAGEELSCDCAAPVCELSDGRLRSCSVAIAAAEENIDILCQDQAQ